MNCETIHTLFWAYDSLHLGSYIESRHHQYIDFSLRFLALRYLHWVAKPSICCLYLTIPCISIITLICETIHVTLFVLAYDPLHFSNYIELRNRYYMNFGLRFFAFRSCNPFLLFRRYDYRYNLLTPHGYVMLGLVPCWKSMKFHWDQLNSN